MRQFILLLSLLVINLGTVFAQKEANENIEKKGKIRSRRKKSKLPPEETEIAGAWIEGCKNCNIWVGEVLNTVSFGFRSCGLGNLC